MKLKKYHDNLDERLSYYTNEDHFKVWYEMCSNKERIKLKKLVAELFGLSYSSIRSKFNGSAQISKAETIALNAIISEIESVKYF